MGKGGTTVREIGQVTGTRMSLSSRDQYYPGTQLQELIIKGSNQESVLSAIGHTLSKISELSGSVCGGEANVEPGGCRLKVIVPTLSAAAIIGPGGSTVKQMREQSHMHIHIEESTIPPGPPTELTEQVVSFSGPLEGIWIALPLMAEALGHFSNEPWFEAWSSNSHCGLMLPGFALFSNSKGKGKSKSKCCKGKMGKGEEEDYGAMVPGLALANMDINQLSPADLASIPPGVLATMMGRAEEGPGAGPSPNGGQVGPAWQQTEMLGNEAGAESAANMGSSQAAGMALKMLVAPEEVNVLGQDSSTMMQIQQATNTIGMLSEKPYPGTTLQELTVQGPTAEAVYNAVFLILNKIAEVMGAVRSGETNIPLGDARVKLVVPKRAAAAIIGPGGQTVKQIKMQTGIYVHVDTNSLPCADGMPEQGVCLAGPLTSLQAALSQVVAEVANFCGEPWFEAWAAHSNTGQVIPGFVLFEGKGKAGKGKGAPGGLGFV